MTKENLILKLNNILKVKASANKKPYKNVEFDIMYLKNDVITTSGESEAETRRRYMHLMYRDGENSTSYEEEFDDYADNTEQTDELEPLETPVETDHEKLQEKIKQSKEDLEKAKQIIENELK